MRNLFIDEVHGINLDEHGIEEVYEPQGIVARLRKIGERLAFSCALLGICIVHFERRIDINLSYFLPMSHESNLYKSYLMVVVM